MKIVSSLLLLCLVLYSCGPSRVVYNDSANNYTQAPPPTPAPPPAPVYQPAPPPPISFQTFYDELSPYGTWIQSPNYGYVWSPNAGPDFTPYTSAGNWQYSNDYGWIWASDYPWGWAPFHYGRWFIDDMFGWMWVPGYEWAPAWVVWGSYQDYSGNYYGWAPMGPGVTYSASGYYPPANYWTFVPSNRVCEQNVYNYRAQNVTVVNNNVTIINNSYTYNNQSYYAGPRATEVERATGRQITPVVVREATNPGKSSVANKELSIYRPAVNTTNATKAAPAQIVPRESLKPITTRQATNPVHSNTQNPEPKPTSPPPVAPRQATITNPTPVVKTAPAQNPTPRTQPSQPAIGRPAAQPTPAVQQPAKPVPAKIQTPPANTNQKQVKKQVVKPANPALGRPATQPDKKNDPKEEQH